MIDLTYLIDLRPKLEIPIEGGGPAVISITLYECAVAFPIRNSNLGAKKKLIGER
jgi:hypothetical protein